MNLKDKIIAFDIDGTLARNDAKPSTFTCETIKKLVNEGYHICLVTGRQWISSADIYQKCGLKEACVFCNGAFVYHPIKDVIIHEIKIPKEDVFYFVDNLELLDCVLDIMYEVEWDTYSLKGYPWNVNQINGDFHQNLKKEPCSLNIIAKSMDQQEKIKAIITSLKNYNYRYWNLQGEVYNAEFSKKEGLNHLLDYYHKTEDDLIFFGDASNDKSALMYAKYSVAMKNANDEIKKISRYVSDYTNEEDGAIRFLLKLIENEKILDDINPKSWTN